MLKNKSRDYIDNLCFFCWVLLASIPKLHSINQQYNISNCIVREPISPLSFMALVIYPSPSYLALLSSYFVHSELILPTESILATTDLINNWRIYAIQKHIGIFHQ